MTDNIRNAHESEPAVVAKNNDAINNRLTDCLKDGASNACYMAAYDQANTQLNKEWNKLPKEERPLAEQKAWLAARDENFGSPDAAMQPGAAPASGKKGPLAGPESLKAVEQRTLDFANIYEKLNSK